MEAVRYEGTLRTGITIKFCISIKGSYGRILSRCMTGYDL